MEAIILSKEQYNTMLAAIEEIKAKLTKKIAEEEDIIDNQQFLLKMKISKRTAQTWRDEGKIPFSQVGNKIYYKLEDIKILLKKHYRIHPKFNQT